MSADHHDHHHGHHAHGHDHGPVLAAPPASLLRMGAGERMGWAAAVILLIWVGVYWAMT